MLAESSLLVPGGASPACAERSAVAKGAAEVRTGVGLQRLLRFVHTSSEVTVGQVLEDCSIRGGAEAWTRAPPRPFTSVQRPVAETTANRRKRKRAAVGWPSWAPPRCIECSSAR